MTQITIGQIAAAAQWWSERLSNCKHSGLSDRERKDPTNDGYQLAEMLMTVGRPRVTQEQINAFRVALIDRITKASPYEQRSIAVDYGPDRVLDEALSAAGIPSGTGTLPIKTTMWLSDEGKVVVRYGYGASAQVIYEEPASVAAVDPVAANSVPLSTRD